MIPETIEAPRELSDWLRSEAHRLSSRGIVSDLRVPPERTDSSKASVTLNAGTLIGSITIWSTGMAEFIAVDADGTDRVSRDVETHRVAELRSTLSRFLDEFVALMTDRERAMMPSPPAKSAEEIRGLEYDWLASDEDGHVALFSTAGAGYAPAEFLRDTDAHDAAIDAILALPPSTAARFAPELVPGPNNIWKQVAERGLFAFDCHPNGGPYRRVAAPMVPLQVDDLPVTAVEVVSRLRLPLRFEAAEVIGAESLSKSRID